jgi:hypothetical protein
LSRAGIRNTIVPGRRLQRLMSWKIHSRAGTLIRTGQAGVFAIGNFHFQNLAYAHTTSAPEGLPLADLEAQVTDVSMRMADFQEEEILKCSNGS